MTKAEAPFEAPSFDTLRVFSNPNPYIRPGLEPIGDPDLTIYPFHDEIVQALNSHPAIVIDGGTGSGKSSYVPLLAFEAGFDVIETQPRIVAARSLAEYIRFNLVNAIGDVAINLVGYHTANEGDHRPDNIITLVTEDILLNQLLAGQSRERKTVNILDEAHEQSTAMEFNLAQMRHSVLSDPNYHGIVMSATIDSDRIARFLSDKAGVPAPIIKVPGRRYNVEQRQGGGLVDDVVNYALEGAIVQTFVPGKGDIAATMGALRKRLPADMAILALHGDQTARQQNLVFDDYPGGKVIVSTNAGQTSLTIPGLGVVVDCGWERVGDVVNGVEGLYIRPISIASADQRYGRAGRTKDGLAIIDARLDGYPPVPPRDKREAYDKPEILRSRLDGRLLKHAQSGIDIASLKLLNPPRPEDIAGARQRLVRLGALALGGELTTVGKNMEFLPIDPHFARMVVAARDCSEAVALQLAATVAVQQAKGIIQTDSSSAMRWNKLSKDQTSDVLRELDVFLAARSMDEEQLDRHDIAEKRFIKARDTYLNICETEQLQPDQLTSPTEIERQEVLNCMITGTDELFVARGKGFVDRRGTYRRPPLDTVIPKGTPFVIGSPYTLQKMGHNGPVDRNIIRSASAVARADMLEAAAPDRCSYQPRNYLFWGDGSIHLRRELLFDGVRTKHFSSQPATGSTELTTFMLRSLVARSIPKTVTTPPNGRRLQQTIAQLKRFEARSVETLGAADIAEQLIGIIAQRIPADCVTLAEVDKHIPDIMIEDLLSIEEMDWIHDNAPETITIAGEEFPVTYMLGTAVVTLPRDHWKVLPDTLVKQLGERRVLVNHPADATKLDLADALEIAHNQPRRLRRKQAATKVLDFGGLQLVPSSGLPFGPSPRASRPNQFVPRRSHRSA